MAVMPTILVDECIDVIADYAGVKLTGGQFASLMEKNPELKEQLIKFNSPNDTMDREDMISALAKQVTGRSWPTYGEGTTVYNKFVKDFDAGCRAQGIEILED